MATQERVTPAPLNPAKTVTPGTNFGYRKRLIKRTFRDIDQAPSNL
jgi:hypothetical protein